MKIVLIVCILLAFFLCVNQLYKKSNYYWNECFDVKNYIKGIPDGLKIVNIGSTYSKFAFGAYEDLGLNAVDLSLQAQSLDVDYAILKQYHKKFDNGCLVFICLAACCMLYEGNSSNCLYPKILDKKYNPKKSLKGKMESYFPLIIHPFKIKRVIKGKVRYKNIYETFDFNISKEEADEILLSMANGWIKMFDLLDLRSVDLSKKNLEIISKNREILNSMIIFCIENGYRPIVIVPPFSANMNKYFSKEFSDLVIEKSIQETNFKERVIYLNYQRDNYFQNRIDLFIDGGFRLNKYGSKVFLKRVFSDLKKYGIDVCNQKYGVELNDY